ncbi:MAG: glycosyltransferase [Verrucomicrobiota bacterium]
MIFHCELSKEKRKGGLDQAVYDITKTLNDHTRQTHARVGDYPPSTLKGVQAVHFHGLWSYKHIRLANWCRRQKIPYIVSPHGMLEPWALGNKYIKKLIHRIFFTNRYLSSAQTLLATSEIERENIKRLFPNQSVEMIPLGVRDLPETDPVTARKFCKVDGSTFHLLYLSRIDRKKNLDLLIRALKRVSEEIKQNIRLTIIGDGNNQYLKECMGLASKVRSKHVEVSFKGPIWDDSKWQWMAAADLFCLPSSSENFGYAYLESLAVGTSILTTRGTPWAQHAREDFIFCADTDVESIAHEIVRSRSVTISRKEVIEWVGDNYLWERLVPSYCELYPVFPEHEQAKG